MSQNNTPPKWLSAVFIPILQLAIALGISSLVVLIVGESPVKALEALINGAFNLQYGLASTLYYTTHFIFTGLAVAIAFHAGLFNIGGEGQAYVAGLGVTFACLAFDSWLPAILMFPLVIAASAAFGAAWAFLPGYLQAKRGSHIVVTTIMFNFIGFSLVSYVLVELLRDQTGASLETRAFADSALMPQIHEIARALGFQMAKSHLNLSFVVALLAAVGVWLLLWRSRLGYAIRVIGQNPRAADYAGIPRQRIVVIAMLISGGLAGMMAVNEIYGAQGRLVLNFTNGFGFIGIAVAVMGRNHPVGVVLSALLFGALYQGGTDLQFDLPKLSPELILVIQGLVIFFTAASDRLIRHPIEQTYLRLTRKAEAS